MKELKEILDFAMSMHMAYDKAKADGKVDMLDLGLLMDPIMKLIPAVENAKMAKDEIMSMDEAKRKELDEYVKANYDIADDALEVKIEKGLGLAIHLAEFFGAMKNDEPQV